MDTRARIVEDDGADDMSALSPAVRVRVPASGSAPETTPDAASGAAPGTAPGFLRRHRMALLLGAVALCLYLGSILYIVYGRGPVA